ncbi:MAG TPA: TadE/TadG family type IV pilus assembly protein [Oscillospiraceae bacterium]|nr:TadE/TadG family type IV pilus assembly protein [Oscillospiraceae bacterium]HPF55298.1 TadE/TadG family type IV pilus assembly protein [Clostridiales bacterium]HPK34701.1 TadE/TadG family type IV pilus assembly protein [Oscillospiraceae bacterium]HPR74535.1 TadE/TadG family type IV pilus assembly protein [Oscillospiraceae bacterium]
MNKQFLKNKIRHCESGQSMVEMALITPVLLLLLCGIIEFGILFGNQLTIQNDSREAARYASIHATETDVEDSIAEMLGTDALTSDKTVTISFTDSSHKTGYVTVTVTTIAPAITPIGYMFFEDGEKELVSATTMKVE